MDEAKSDNLGSPLRFDVGVSTGHLSTLPIAQVRTTVSSSRPPVTAKMKIISGKLTDRSDKKLATEAGSGQRAARRGQGACANRLWGNPARLCHSAD